MRILKSECENNPLKIIVAGCGYGAGNIGDEAILAGIIDMLKDRFPSTEIRVMSFNPKVTEKMHCVESFVWMHLVSVTRIIKCLREINRADFILLGGGTLGDDTYSLRYPILSTVQMILLLKVLGINCGMFAIGVNRFTTKIGEKLVKYFYGSTCFLTVRDNESKKNL